MSDFENNIITLTDEDGEEHELEHLDTFEHDGETYMIFGVDDSEDEDEMAIIIMSPFMQDGEELLEEVQDEEILDEVYQIFLSRVEEDGDE